MIKYLKEIWGYISYDDKYSLLMNGVALIFWIMGYWILIAQTNWYVGIALFIILWGNNISNSIEIQKALNRKEDTLLTKIFKK